MYIDIYIYIYIHAYIYVYIYIYFTLYVFYIYSKYIEIHIHPQVLTHTQTHTHTNVLMNITNIIRSYLIRKMWINQSKENLNDRQQQNFDCFLFYILKKKKFSFNISNKLKLRKSF